MKVRFIQQKFETEGVYSFIFETEQEVSWIPGQYIHYTFPHPHQDDRGVERWFTVSSAPFEKHLMLTTRMDGERRSTFKEALMNLEPGTEVEADEPEGKFVLGPDDKHYIMISGGIGITPFRSMLAQANYDGKMPKATLLYANRDDNLVFDDELSSIAASSPQFKIQKYIGDQRISADELKEFLAGGDTVFYVSGPKPMVENYYNKLLELGGSEDRVKKDFFPGY